MSSTETLSEREFAEAPAGVDAVNSTATLPEREFCDALAGVDAAEGDDARIARLVGAGALALDDPDRWAGLTEAAVRLGLRDGWLGALAERAAQVADAPPRVEHARALLAVGDVAAGRAAFERALAAAPDNLVWRGELVVHAQRSEDFESALAHLAVLEADPRIVADAEDAAWVRTMKAVTLGALGRLDEAVTVARGRDDGALASTHGRLLCELGLRTARQLIDANRFADALAIVDRVLTAHVVGEPRALLLYERVRAMFALQQLAELVAPAEQLLAITADEDLRAYANMYLAFGQEVAGDLPASLAAARAALDKLPEGPEQQLVLLVSGRVLSRMGRFGRALVALRKIDEGRLEAGLDGELAFLCGLSLLRFGRPAEALAALDRASELQLIESRRVELQALRGMAMIALGKPAEAAAVFAEVSLAAPSAPERAEALFQSARAWEQAQHPEPALAAAAATLEALAGTGSDRSRQLNAGVQMLRARIAVARKDPQAAVEAIDLALSSWPGYAGELDLVDLRWNALMQSGRLADAGTYAAEANARASLAGHPHVGMMCAEAARQSGRTVDARAALAAAAAVPERFAQEPRAWFASALANIGLVRMGAALDAFARLEALDPAARGSPQIRFWKMLARINRSHADNAQEVLDDLDVSQPQLSGQMAALAMLARGTALAQLKRFAEAVEVLARALRLIEQTPDAPPNWAAQAHWVLSSALFAQGKSDEAFVAMEKALAAPGDSTFERAFTALARLQRAAMRMLLDRVEDGVADARAARLGFQALRETQGLRAELWARGERDAALREIDGLLRLARHEEALAAAERLARDPSPARPIALLLEGSALMGLEDWHRALATFIRARKQAAEDSDPAAIEMRARLEEAVARQKIGDHEHAILTLQQALADHEGAATPDPWFWLLLGSSYYELARLEPARAALERAGRCAADETRGSAKALRSQIALELSAVLVKLGRHEAAIRAIDDAGDSGALATGLAYNRGVACLEQYRDGRDAAWLLRARESLGKAAAKGHRAAGDALRQLERKAGAGGSWFDYWFGGEPHRGRRATGVALAALAASVLFVLPLAAFWRHGEIDWKVLPVPALGALLLFLLPGIKNLSLAWGDLKFSAEPVADAGGGAAATLPSLIGTMVDAKLELGAFSKAESFFSEIVASSGEAGDSPLMQGFSEAIYTGPGARPGEPLSALAAAPGPAVGAGPVPGVRP